MKSDRQETEAKRFKDPRSHITKRGDEVLYGEDWDERKFELLLRARGQCEYIMANDERCLREGVDPHHRVLRSTRRNDTLEALQLLCRHHHRMVDAEQRKIHGKNKIGFDPERAA